MQLNRICNQTRTTILFCKRCSSSSKKNLPQNVLVPETQLAWEILMFTGGSTPGAQVATVSWKHMVVFALFCEGLASVSQNNPVHCTTVWHCSYLMKQRAEIPPTELCWGSIFRNKAGPFNLRWESRCVFCFIFFLKFSLSSEETSNASKFLCMHLN